MKTRTRGAMYVAILVTAMVVATLGISGLAVVRLQMRSQGGDKDAAVARAAAHAAVEWAAAAVANDANWRTTYSSGVWYGSRSLGLAALSWKLVDSTDDDLANDLTQPVRVYGRATVGSAMRSYSVKLEPPFRPNLLANAGMELGAANWSAQNCSLAASATSPHGGTLCLNAANLLISPSGMRQAVTGLIQKDATYELSTWVRSNLSSEDVILRIQTVASGSGTTNYNIGPVRIGSSWARISGYLTPSWTGTLTSVEVQMLYSALTNTVTFDDVTLVRVDSMSLSLVPGTWRQEINP